MSYPDDPGHAKGSKTSKAAAESMKPKAASLRSQVLSFIEDKRVWGATDDEIEVALGLRHQTASARRRELVLEGLVCDSGTQRKTRSGRSATVWVVDRTCETCFFWSTKRGKTWCPIRNEHTDDHDWCKSWDVRRP